MSTRDIDAALDEIRLTDPHKKAARRRVLRARALASIAKFARVEDRPIIDRWVEVSEAIAQEWGVAGGPE